MLKMYFLFTPLLFYSCVATKQPQPEKFTIRLTQHAHHVVDDCILTFGLLPVLEIDTVALTQLDSDLNLMIRIDECKMDGLKQSFFQQTVFDSFFKGECINGMSISQLVQKLNAEFMNFSIGQEDFKLKSVSTLNFDLEVLRCVDQKIYPIRDGFYRCSVKDGYVESVERGYIVSED